MAETPGGHAEIHIGGDAHGPVIAGNDNRVETRRPDPEPATQTNTASDNATIYAVTQGDLHVHHKGNAP
ncbi:hypothetical protein [Streptomyces radicis]|uniref:Uncharacterized protein n=1 Tax=Streptomyces radicis TaxID=1750517 RepID=A0A3A9WDP0_9ACTN|nr:hypothetical protein [Streptomyces radicis]RKN11451.1 hypothetical protein D7319_05780 [Streptomyces radicis]RKN26529.1 hypothetical protein D7318_03880 [Streptomyces radicis]